MVIHTVEMHTGGEPLRIIQSGRQHHSSTVRYLKEYEQKKDYMWHVFPSLSAGYPPIEGATILEKRRYVRSHLDHLRTLLMFEPTGHADMYGALLVDSDLPEVDMAVLFMHNEGKGQSRASTLLACASVMKVQAICSVTGN